jgi:serine/threonine-protein kinase
MSAHATSGFDAYRGRRVGKYEILTRLSVGGMAELYLAALQGPGGFKKFVVLKQILPHIRADDSFINMFLDEARITAAFSHANIGQVFELGEDPETHDLYLSMEFIAGQNLEQVFARAAAQGVGIPVALSARVVHDACLGLHYAHHFRDQATGERTPVIHRDVSPKNVMITYAGTVKMIDFGIAKAMGRLNRTQVGIVKGTSGYMAPEQVRNEPLDGRADLFAAAVMLYEFLSGDRLFVAPDDVMMMRKIASADVPPLHRVNPTITQALSEVVTKGLAKKRDQRWATGKEFARAIAESCPSMFDDDAVADFMSKLFADKVVLTRSVLELANLNNDPVSLSRAVSGLSSEMAAADLARPLPRAPRKAGTDKIRQSASGLAAAKRPTKNAPRSEKPPPPAFDGDDGPSPSIGYDADVTVPDMSMDEIRSRALASENGEPEQAKLQSGALEAPTSLAETPAPSVVKVVVVAGILVLAAGVGLFGYWVASSDGAGAADDRPSEVTTGGGAAPIGGTVERPVSVPVPVSGEAADAASTGD